MFSPKRQDDTKEIAEIRYSEYLEKTLPLLTWYEEKKLLKKFDVKKGMADADRLIDIMKENL